MVVLCYWSQWSVDEMVSYLIGGVMVSILALSVLDPWDRAPVWSNQRLYNWYVLLLYYKSVQVRTKTGRLGIGILINVPEWSDMSSHSLVFFIRHQQFYW